MSRAYRTNEFAGQNEPIRAGFGLEQEGGIQVGGSIPASKSDLRI